MHKCIIACQHTTTAAKNTPSFFYISSSAANLKTCSLYLNYDLIFSPLRRNKSYCPNWWTGTTTGSYDTFRFVSYNIITCGWRNFRKNPKSSTCNERHRILVHTIWIPFKIIWSCVSNGTWLQNISGIASDLWTIHIGQIPFAFFLFITSPRSISQNREENWLEETSMRGYFHVASYLEQKIDKTQNQFLRELDVRLDSAFMEYVFSPRIWNGILGS